MSSLFHSLVVCGAGITLLQCGGRAQVSGDEPMNGGTGGSMGGRGSSAQGGVVSVGGTLSLGGALSTGGTIDVGGSTWTAGSSSVGGSLGAAGSFGSFGGASAWQQWDCSADNLNGCAYGQDMAFSLAHSCAVNSSRPRSAKDCAAGQVFSCLLAQVKGETGPVNCACLPRTPDVPCPCPGPSTGCETSYASACSDFQVQCGCAYTCILK